MKLDGTSILITTCVLLTLFSLFLAVRADDSAAELRAHNDRTMAACRTMQDETRDRIEVVNAYLSSLGLPPVEDP